MAGRWVVRGLVAGEGRLGDENCLGCSPATYESALRGRCSSPTSLPAPARQPALADLDPDTGRARLSYRRAEELFSAASGGCNAPPVAPLQAHHLAEHGIQLPILLAKSRHTSLSSLAIYSTHLRLRDFDRRVDHRASRQERGAPPPSPRRAAGETV